MGESTSPLPASKRFKADPTKSAIGGIFAVEEFVPSDHSNTDLLMCLEENREAIEWRIIEGLGRKSGLKWYIIVSVKLTRTTQEGGVEEIVAHFASKCATEIGTEDVITHLDEGFGKIQTSFEEFTSRGSGWALHCITKIELYTAEYEPLHGSSYIPLPPKLAAKKAILNIQNGDMKCFIWCLLAHKLNIDQQQHANRVSHYTPHEGEIEMGNVECPVPISKIPKLERLNNIRINVYGYEDDEIFPLYISQMPNEDTIHLLLISDDTTKHYCLIRDLNRLLSDRSLYKSRKFYCERCLHRFKKQKSLDEHRPYCGAHAPQKTRMPSEEEKWLTFKNVHYQHKIPYVIYADFECMTVKHSSATPSNVTSYTLNTSSHIPCGYAYIVIGPDGKAFKPLSVYRGENVAEHFLNALVQEKEVLAEKLVSAKPLKMSAEEEESFRKAKYCGLCKKELGNDRARDHCHLSGKYRSALHLGCNLKFKLSKKIPVVFHNLKNYDAHVIMEAIGKFKDHEVEVIPATMEKYISFGLSKKFRGVKITLQFLDSFQFMPSSLEKLVQNLPADQFSILRENHDAANIELLLRKGVYPYDYIDSHSRFTETTLPPPEAFFNSLSGEHIIEEDYAHAQKVWETFNIRHLGEYHDFYVSLDVIQLADVFENFRRICQDYYDLDCTHLMTAPGLAWQACLKMSDFPLELITDIDMHLFLEGGIRGGISMISKRHSQANNKYLDDFNLSKPSKYIMYLDANNLYGWAMSQPLPYGEFQWVPSEGVTSEWIHSLKENDPVGYVFEVDIEYPPELHDEHADYPLMPEKVKIQREELSPFALEILKGKQFVPSTKLVPNLRNKSHYIVHYRNLQFYLKLGVKLQKVHKVLKFKQAPWLKSYIDFNTDKRKHAVNSFEKDFFKLMNNSAFGKTLENVRARKKIDLVTTAVKSKKLIASSAFERYRIFNEDLVGVERRKNCILLNKPIYAGFTVLELSKLHMYRFHYDHVKTIYGPRAQLLFTDTDSLCYEIETEDVYADMERYKEEYDTSDYPPDHPLYCTANKKKIGCFKDELNSVLIKEFVGLRPKMYSILSQQGEKKTAKGVSKHVVRAKIRHEHYRTCLYELQSTRETLVRIQSIDHKLYTIEVNKIALCAFDDKRYLMNTVSSVPYGHYCIPIHDE
jgi:hypothetical protein